jgi:hypothetical protein
MVANGVCGPDENKKFPTFSRICRVSSVVEQLFCKPLVGSSNLSPGTNGLGRCIRAVRDMEQGAHNVRRSMRRGGVGFAAISERDHDVER